MISHIVFVWKDDDHQGYAEVQSRATKTHLQLSIFDDCVSELRKKPIAARRGIVMKDFALRPTTSPFRLQKPERSNCYLTKSATSSDSKPCAFDPTRIMYAAL